MVKKKQKCREVKTHKTKGQIVSTSELRKEQQASQEDCDDVTETTGTSHEVLTDLQLRGESDTQASNVGSLGWVSGGQPHRRNMGVGAPLKERGAVL